MRAICLPDPPREGKGIKCGWIHSSQRRVRLVPERIGAIERICRQGLVFRTSSLLLGSEAHQGEHQRWKRTKRPPAHPGYSIPRSVAPRSPEAPGRDHRRITTTTVGIDDARANSIRQRAVRRCCWQTAGLSSDAHAEDGKAVGHAALVRGALRRYPPSHGGTGACSKVCAYWARGREGVHE